MITRARKRLLCIMGHHEPDDFPEGLTHCVRCGAGPIDSHGFEEEDDWATDLFGDDELV